MVRSFLPVGQGAFYHECFKQKDMHDNINIVYDCGSSTDVRIVEREIRNSFQTGETIDALFISHLHEDHVNGIPYLLKYCNVKRIYFPLINFKNRNFMEVYYYVNNIDGFTFDFFRNPNEAIGNLSLENRPMLIGIDEARGQSASSGIEQEDMRYQRSGDNVFETIMLERDMYHTAYGNWLYIPFNFRQTDRVQTLLQNLRIQFQKEIMGDELVRLWVGNSPGDRDKIKQAYASVPGGFNVNSMTLFSGETNHNFHQYKINCHNCCSCWRSRPSGCLYTGDYDASGSMKWKELINDYYSCWEHIGCVQVPHHGSKHNFNPDFLKLDAYFIISAGYANKYHHPHASVMRAFLLQGIMPHIVTEHAGNAAYFAIC